MNRWTKAALSVVVCSMFLLSVPAASVSVSALISLDETLATADLSPISSAIATPLTSHPFAFVSNFEDKKLDGWKKVTGSVPKVVSSPSYSGEPSLQSSNLTGFQIDRASQGFAAGQPTLSFQVAIDAATGASGYFGLGNGSRTFVAVVGVQDGSVVAGSNLAKLKVVEAVPQGTAYPAGWVYISTIVSEGTSPRTMEVFIDGSSSKAATISVPKAVGYTDALIETTDGVVHYTNIVVSTYEIPIYIPGYNNMEGYGQGSGLLVSLLPAFDNYTATMTLHTWSVPQANILSFQINAMNYTGTTTPTCEGFFQLGVDLNPSGKIAPWWVPGVNCEAHYFVGTAGVATPAGSVLVLHILFESSTNVIRFEIDDTTTGTVWSHDLSYSGGAFYGAYTQMEFQPCCNSSPIGDYKLDGSLTDMQITPVGEAAEDLPASYMLPFLLDAPGSWNYGYYQNSSGGYTEVST